MRDIPVFTTAAGVASLILKEIPYKKEAYIKIQDSCEPEQLIKECCDFCSAVGAEHIYASGHAALEKYTLHTALLRMSRPRADLPRTDAILIPVEEGTLEEWRTIYNAHMSNVPNSATMTMHEAEQMLIKGAGYFVYRSGALIGIGNAAVDTVDAVVALIPGVGQDVFLALCRILTSEQIRLEVASENKQAIRMYQRLGFVQTEEVSRWYKIK